MLQSKCCRLERELAKHKISANPSMAAADIDRLMGGSSVSLGARGWVGAKKRASTLTSAPHAF